MALWGRFDFNYSSIPSNYLSTYINTIFIYALLCIIVFSISHLYRNMWRFASFDVLFSCFVASFICSIVYSLVLVFFYNPMPRTYYLWGSLFQFLLVGAIRFSYKAYIILKRRYINKYEVKERIMVIGAGSAGQMIIRDINGNSNDSNSKVVCVIDDNPNKWNRYIHNVPIVGGREDILLNTDKYKINTIYLAIPSLSNTEKRDILNICKETDCKIKSLPNIYSLNDNVTSKDLKEVSVEDLLGREPIKANLDEVFKFINNKTILVTGGGGSIGSELCRQIAAHNPKQLIIFDIYENNAYSIQLELQEKYPDLNLVMLIGSIRDSRRIYEVFDKYKPEIVYHAAAHKHVPLMEDSPCEAIKNNTIGTYKTAYAAMVHGTKRFVLISTDKAVNPTNIMGASKRLCEMIIQSFDKLIKQGKANLIPQLFTHEEYKESNQDIDYNSINTEFVAVRFGNVLGSNGSVIPIFKKQLEKGGPLTVTHPDIVRYFMTIPEAVSLVLLAGTYAKGGEIFVLDMGTPVKIDDLARNLIKLAGLKPDIDIQIKYTGLRPGEKMYEEKLMAEEGLTKTNNDLIFIGKPLDFNIEDYFKELEQLMELAYKNKDKEVVSYIQSLGENIYKPLTGDRLTQ